MEDSVFDSIESAHEFVRMLASEVAVVRQGVRGAHHLAASSRVLNDLTMLRRILIRDAEPDVEGAQES